MKAIILISSIFYILGLKIGNKIDLVKKVIRSRKLLPIILSLKNQPKPSVLKMRLK
ncbi:MAG: hypothetical protein HOG79_03510 [Prolixibacteraceae bacterium]|nr:hypothetical protein [Prolixibacteraceae bacterium]